MSDPETPEAFFLKYEGEHLRGDELREKVPQHKVGDVIELADADGRTIKYAVEQVVGRRGYKVRPLREADEREEAS